MRLIDGNVKESAVVYGSFGEHEGQLVTISGYIHRIREMTGFSFVLIRTRDDVVQCVYAPEFSDYRWDGRQGRKALRIADTRNRDPLPSRRAPANSH